MTGEEAWQSTEPLSNVGYDLTDGLEEMEGEGTLIVRVFYNCNDEGARCTRLGRFPNNTLQTVDYQQIRPASAGAAGSGVQGAGSGSVEVDPVTGLLRSDLTVT